MDKYISIILLLFILVLGSTHSQAQDKWDEKGAHFLIDSLLLKKRATKPLKAVLLSAAFPGAGQVYNRQYYKLHIVYGAIGGMIYAIDFNTRGFKKFDEAYRARLRGDDTPEFPASLIPDQSLANRREEFRKDKETSYFGLGLVYVLNIADAFVSSHLTTFDIKDDLVKGNLKLIETMDWTGIPFPSVGVAISF